MCSPMAIVYLNNFLLSKFFCNAQTVPACAGTSSLERGTTDRPSVNLAVWMALLKILNVGSRSSAVYTLGQRGGDEGVEVAVEDG